MKTKYVIDAGALALYFAGDEKAKSYIDRILDGKAEGYMCEVNLAELYYKMASIHGRELADIKYEAIRESPIKLVPAAGELTRQAELVKLTYRRRISLADAYLIALARHVRGSVITTDTTIKSILRDRCVLLEL